MARSNSSRSSKESRTLIGALVLLLVGMAFLAGCAEQPANSPVVAQGILHSVSYILGDGRVGGFTRLPHAQAVPGGNGSWNVDAYGRLTRDFLLVTYPHDEDQTRHAIPVHCLLHVKFGDAGRSTVKPDAPNSPAGPTNH